MPPLQNSKRRRYKNAIKLSCKSIRKMLYKDRPITQEQQQQHHKLLENTLYKHFPNNNKRCSVRTESKISFYNETEKLYREDGKIQ